MFETLSEPRYSSLVILWLAIAVDALWRWPQSSHPLTFMRYLFHQMGKKVLPSSDFGPMQHYISATLAVILLIGPLAICIHILINMAEYPVFFEGLILLSLVDFGFQRQQYKKVLACVGRNKKSLAREMVATITARQCHLLSDIGVAKAAIESLWLKFLYLYCGVLFYYVVLGPIAALIYRLLLLASWQWHYRNPSMRYFAIPARTIVNVLVIPPCVVGSVGLMSISHPVRAIRALYNAAARDKTSLILALFGGVLDVKLGGPAMYADQKIRNVRVGGENEVKYSHMLNAKQLIEFAMISVATMYSLIIIVFK